MRCIKTQNVDKTTEKIKPAKICDYCSSEFIQNNHRIFCHKNPERKIRVGGNQYTKAKKLGLKYEVSYQSLEKSRLSQIGRKHKPETIAKIKESMSKAVENNPESYCVAKISSRVKRLSCSNGFIVQGTWEQSFVEFCLQNSLEIIQDRKWFEYTDGETKRKYFPDFYLPTFDLYVEVKGYKRKIDDVKWESLIHDHKKSLLIVDARSIYRIKNNSITIDELLKKYCLV